MSTLFILYGSATGNSEHIAKTLFSSLPPSQPPFYNSIYCDELNTFKRKCLPIWSKPRDSGKHPVIIITATTGNADPPENASRFVRFIKKREEVEKKPFQHCGFAVLGLGDTNYDQFCAVGKLIDRKLGELGGIRAKPLGMADEATGLEDVVEPWKKTILEDLKKTCLGGDGAMQEEKAEKEENQSDVQRKDETENDMSAKIGSRPNVPALVGSRPNVSSTVGSRPNVPAGVGSRPSVPTTVGSRPAVPVGVGSRPSVPSTVGSRPTVPSSVGSRPTVPAGVGSRPSVPLTVGSRPTVPSSVGSRPTFPAGVGSRPSVPSTVGSRPTIPSTVGSRPSIPSAVGSKPAISSDKTVNGDNNTSKYSKNSIIGTIDEKKQGDSLPQHSSEKTTSSSPGLATIHFLAQKLNLHPLPTVIPTSALPSISKSMSSCEFVSEDQLNQRKRSSSLIPEDHMTLSSFSSASSGFHYTLAHPYHAPVVDAKYLTNTSVKAATGSTKESDPLKKLECFEEEFPRNEFNQKRVLELSLQLPDDFTLEYQPGDSIGLCVTNKYTPELKIVLKMLEKEHGVKVETDLVKVNEGEPITVRKALEECVDLTTSPVKKHVLAALEEFTTCPEEAFMLRFLSSKLPAGMELYEEYVVKHEVNFGDLLQDFPNCKPTLQGILGMLPGIAPRYYSIASSPLEEEGTLKIALSVVDYFLNDKRKGGLATTYLEMECAPLLANLPPKEKLTVPIFPKPTTDFRLPSNPSIPLILIGPGTGVCPFLGFISHRRGMEQLNSKKENMANEGIWRGGMEVQHKEDSQTEEKKKRGSIDLFFGCRYPHHDFLYKKEFEEYQKEEYLTNLFVSFSRVGETKEYVQHKLKEKREEMLKRIVEENASIYLCGDGNHMAKDVQDCIVQMLEDSKTVKDAKGYFEDMKKRKKFLMDIWS